MTAAAEEAADSRAVVRRPTWVSAVCVLAMVSTAVMAKGITMLIEIERPGLPTLRITDRGVRQFDVWEGPGVGGVSMADGDGFIVAWKHGPVAARPSGLTRYEVRFSAGCGDLSPTCPSLDTVPAYAVSYEFDPASGQGFVYVPGPGEKSYAMNAASIYRGPAAEGHWFVATDAWNSFVRPIILGPIDGQSPAAKVR